MSLEDFGATSRAALRPVHKSPTGEITCPVSGDPVSWTEGELEIPVAHLVRADLRRALESQGVEYVRSRGYESHKHDILMPETCEDRSAPGYSSQFVGVQADLGETVARIPVRQDDLPADLGLGCAHEPGQSAESAGESEDGPNPATRIGHVQHDDVDVYAGRHGDDGEKDLLTAEIGEPGWLGNPYPAEVFGREESVGMFTHAFMVQLENRPELRKAVYQLQGQVLGCWCQRLEADEPLCHAEVIAEVADRMIRPAGGDSA